jgi:hypothetical protein
MSIYRFFTKPSMQFSFLQLVGMLTVVSGAILFSILHLDGKQDSAREARLMQRLDDARAEVLSLKKAAETKRNGTPRSASASLKVSSETETETPAVHAPDHSDVSISDDTLEVVHTGPLKGLPLDLAKEIHKEYTAAALARAKRYHEWDLRRKDFKERERALFEKELAHKDVLIANSKKRAEISLAVYARMSPEQLESAREEALKTQPAEVVDSFFTQIAASRTDKSPEEIDQAVQDIEKTHEALGIERQELVAEREQITREEEELQGTKPLPPNLGLDEFYTEWKKRNSPKPSP